MPPADAALRLRPPLWARIWVVLFPLVLAVLLLFDLVQWRGDPGWPTRIAISAFGAALGWRLFRLAALGTPDGRLVVRNHWRDRTPARDEIVEVAVAGIPGRPNRSVRLQLRNGSSVLLDVTEAPSFLRGGLDRQAAAVREWVDGRPAPGAGITDTR